MARDELTQAALFDDDLAEPAFGESSSENVELQGSINADELALIAALQGRFVQRQKLKISKVSSERLVEHVIRDFYTTIAQSQPARSNHLEFLKVWRSTPEPKTFPFEGASNIQVPLTSSTFEQMLARLLKALLGSPKLVDLASLDESVPEATVREVETWFQSELEHTVKLQTVLYDILHGVLMDGFALPVSSYERREKRLTRRVEQELAEGEVKVFDQMMQMLGREFEGQEFEVSSTDTPGRFEIQHLIPKDSRMRTAFAEFSLDGATLVCEVEKDEVVFDGVCIRVPNFEDIVVPNTACDVDEVPFFGLRSFWSVAEFRQMLRQDELVDLRPEQVEKVELLSSSKIDFVVPQEQTDELNFQEGADSRDTLGPAMPVDEHISRRWILVYRWEGLWPINGDDSPEVDVCAWIDPRSRTLLKIERLETLNKDGERSPVKFEYIRQPGRFYPLGLVEWMSHIQEEISSIHNQRLDAGLLANVPFFIYTPAAGMPASTFKIKPGEGLPVRDVNGVLFPRLNFQPMWSFQEEAGVLRFAREQSGISEPAAGQFLTKRTSASEFIGTQGASDIRTEVFVKRLGESLQVLLTRVFGLYQQFMPPGRVYRVAGERGEMLVRQFERDRLHGKFVLQVNASTQMIAADFEREVAINMLSLLMNPLLFQMGISGPDTVYEALMAVTRASKYRGVPIHKPDIPVDSDPPELEHKRMLRGESVQPSVSENFSLHIQAHMQFLNNPPIELSQDQMTLFAQHISTTVQMQQMINMLRQQQAVLAAQMQQRMVQMGVNPGMAGGSQAGDQAQGASRQETNSPGTPAPPEQMGQAPMELMQ